MPRVFGAAQVDEVVCRRVIEVTTLLRPPPALLTPAMLLRVFRASRQGTDGVPAAVPVEREPVAA